MSKFCLSEEPLNPMAFYLYDQKQSENACGPCSTQRDYALFHDSSEVHFIESDLFLAQMKTFEQLFAECYLLEDEPSCIDLSKLILMFSKKYLDEAEDWNAQKNVIALVCFAWNLSLFKPSNRYYILFEMLQKKLVKKEFKMVKKKIFGLIAKKIWKYHFIERFITRCELIQSQGGFYLQINSMAFDSESEPMEDGFFNCAALGEERSTKSYSAFFRRTLGWLKPSYYQVPLLTLPDSSPDHFEKK